MRKKDKNNNDFYFFKSKLINKIKNFNDRCNYAEYLVTFLSEDKVLNKNIKKKIYDIYNILNNERLYPMDECILKIISELSNDTLLLEILLSYFFL